MKKNIRIIIIPRYKNKLLIKSDCSGFLDFNLDPKHQPEAEINRICQKRLGFVAEDVIVRKVVNYRGNTVIAYSVELSFDDYNQSKKPRGFVWIDIEKIESNSKIVGKIIDDISYKSFDSNDSDDKYILYTDGGSRGNPGDSAIGYAIVFQQKKILEKGEYIGITNSSLAEYQALFRGLEAALNLNIKNLECRIDNLMVVKHLNGEYRVRNREFFPIYEKINKVKDKFDKIKFIHIKREFNEISDSLVNKSLDEYLLKKS